ncbi:MAG: hypothetical protein FVQ82_03250 [Planctomycetes bacterium]|nr:hypothetical protein [Planctomycetota bacterium]
MNLQDMTKTFVCIMIVGLMSQASLVFASGKGQTISGGGNTPSKVTQANVKLVSIFNNAKPDDFQMMTFANINKDWYQAKVTQNKGMFNPVFLAFEYTSTSDVEDDYQPLTFPSLLSFKFDFVPDNYSARHPAFIFRREPVWKIMPEETEKISKYITEWHATHAFGGKVIYTQEGYSGQLLVWDKDGNEVLKQNYKKACPYFTLMGKMVRSWMEYRKQEVSEELYKELTLPMTDDMECVRMYGKSYDVEWRSEDEWQIYESILAKDPNFAEVRFWYANQKAWETGLHDKLRIEKGRALKGHLVIPALWEFGQKKCLDPSILKAFDKALSRAELICPNHSTVLSVKIDTDGDKMTIKELDRYLNIAEKTPCSYQLIKNLAVQYRKRGCYEKSLPLFISAINSGFLKGVGSFDWEWSILAEDFYDLGYIDESIFCAFNSLVDCSERRKRYLNRTLGKAYWEKKQYQRAISAFKRNVDNWPYDLFYVYLCAYESGDLSLLKGLEKNVLKKEKIRFMLSSREFLAKGDFKVSLINLNRMSVKGASPKTNDFCRLHKNIIASDIHILAGDIKTAKKHAIYAFQACPRSRHVAYLLETCAKDDLISLARYAKVGQFICKKDLIWNAMNSRTSKHLAAETKDDVMKLFNEAQKKLAGLSSKDQNDFWRTFFPFEIEYITLYLLNTDDKAIRDEVLHFYLKYCSATRGNSNWQEMHLRSFFFQLLTLIPEEEGDLWKDQLVFFNKR